MIIENASDIEVDFIIRGGPVDMVISKGWLDPGEDDRWDPPRYFKGSCNVEFLWDGGSRRVPADPDDTVIFAGPDEG